MRLASALVVALLASTSLATPTADACGGGRYYPPAPAMFLVATHNGRTFVLLDKRVPSLEGVTWARNFESYDTTEIARAPRFPEARTLTLVGATSTRRLASAKHVFIKPAFETRDAMNAVEVPLDGEQRMQIAIDGTVQNVAWSEAESAPLGLEAAAWGRNPGFSPPLDPSTMSLAKVAGADIDLIMAWTYADGRSIPTTYVRIGGAQPYGGYRGAPRGVVTVDGTRYLVLVEDGLVTPIRL